MSDRVAVFGVLVTFGRMNELKTTIARLGAQTRPPDRLIVIDNGSDRAVEDLIAAASEPGLAIRYVDPGDNLGPAGGYALGMEMILADAIDSDWIVLFDDDDPPFFDDAIQTAVAFGEIMIQKDTRTGGVGISGGRFDFRRGRVVRVGDADIGGAVPVDHITGGGLPSYRVAAVREVGLPNADLFFGFEELEYGLRMIDGGFTLYADGEAWARRKQVKRAEGILPPETVSEARAGNSRRQVGAPSWRRYYSLRNLIHILRKTGHSWTALKVAMVRGLLKPIANLIPSPRIAGMNLAMNWRAMSDGWTGRLGRTLEPGLDARHETR
jgi:rhamnopyranosyl-N-acetylglucosaminyl-diphospho-decaprenol beta-1,3/1,4-galactofuranosyltransferase